MEDLDNLSINTIRTLSIDAVQRANSGHPGTPMSLAPIAYVVWERFLRHNPANPSWPGRDRFILSAGHASILLYSLLYLTGYDLTLDDIKQFRQLGSRTAGHPERGVTAGAETTTGPLGQGFANGVGMALAQRMVAARFARPGHDIFDTRVFAICSDGDLMEGVASEAASLAGHLGLGNLVYIYDQNFITIDGETELTFSEDVATRFNAYGWHVQKLADGPTLAEMEDAVSAAISDERPSLITVRTHIAEGSPNARDTSAAHGAPLGEEEVRLTKENLGWSADGDFYVPDEVISHMGNARQKGAELERKWDEHFQRYQEEHPNLAMEWKRQLQLKLPDGWLEALPSFSREDGPIATRSASGKAMNMIADRVPELVGGSADLAGSTSVVLKGLGDVSAADFIGRNIHFGVREHSMAAIVNGMTLYGNLRPFCSTFLIFSDYMRPAIRLAALMGLPTIYIFSHDSVWLGEDGPTHQPVEQLMSLRALPNLHVMRPADANETALAWRYALERLDGPTALALSRQKLPVISDSLEGASGVLQGGYILAEANGKRPDAILIATGSEVALALEAKELLESRGVGTRVVSMPCWELFDMQEDTYREQVLPVDLSLRVSVEAGVSLGWQRYVGPQGGCVSIERFGASAPYNDLQSEFGFTAEKVADYVLRKAGA